MGETGGPRPLKRPFWRRDAVILFGTMVLGILFFFALGYLVESVTHESTDDAFLDADLVSVAPKVAGQVKQLHVQSNQRVSAGELLLEIDPRDYQVQLEQKQGAVAASRANEELMKATLGLARAQVASAEATAKQSAAEADASAATTGKARADLKRAEDLFQRQTISPQEFDAAKSAATAADASLRAAREKAVSDQSKVAQMEAQLDAAVKAFSRAEAQTRQSASDARAAELNLSYTKIHAPIAGYVTRKAVESGDYVQVGQRLLALVPPVFYVTANFKETQLRQIRTNQPVRIKIDAISGRTFSGHVQSIMAGSGARFSLLPPENAVGNYVKVIQRVPVKILFDEPVEAQHVLGPGMSVVPSIHVTPFEVPEIVIIATAIVLGLVAGVLWRWAARRGHPPA
jgi:membrane fusion protein, multidrug efflux system